MANLALTAWNILTLGSADAAIGTQVHLRLKPFGEGGDDTPPVVALISLPAVAEAPLIVEVTDATALRRVIMTVRFPWLGNREVVYEDDGFAELYLASFITVIPSGLRFTMYRDTGWPTGGAIAVKVYALDLDGNEA